MVGQNRTWQKATRNRDFGTKSRAGPPHKNPFPPSLSMASSAQQAASNQAASDGRAYLGGTMTYDRRHFLKLSAGAIAAPAIARSAAAQSGWPAARPIRAIVPFSAGSTIDILGRIVLDPLSRQLGQTIVV